MTLKSRDIADFFEAKLADIRSDRELTFDFHLYFPANQHVMLWRRKGDTPSADFLNKYKARGLESIWVHRDDEEAFRLYLNPEAAPAETPAPEPEAAAEAAPEPAVAEATPDEPAAAQEAPPETAPEAENAPKTEEGRKIIEAMNATGLSEEQKQQAVAATAQNVVDEIAKTDDMEVQKQLHEEARRVVKDVLDNAKCEAESLISEIWKLAHVDPDLGHAVNVATYSVIFAMSFGRIHPEVIADLALAGLLHDIGISQLPVAVAQAKWQGIDQPTLKAYASHVQTGLQLVDTFAPATGRRVRMYMLQHHEKFDGSGYPQRLQGFGIDDVAQLLGIADVLDSVASGQWDGVKRTYRETFDTLEKLEKARTFPEYFNPEVFAAVMRWTRKTTTVESMRSAIETVGEKTKTFMKGANQRKAG